MSIIGNKNIKELVGKVVSDKMDKTITVVVERVKMHRIYKKRFVVQKKYYANDVDNKAKVGDMVKIREAKPTSKLKRWELVDVMS